MENIKRHIVRATVVLLAVLGLWWVWYDKTSAIFIDFLTQNGPNSLVNSKLDTDLTQQASAIHVLFRRLHRILWIYPSQ